MLLNGTTNLFGALLKISPKYLLDWRTLLAPFIWYSYIHLADKGFSLEHWFPRLASLIASFAVFVLVIWVLKTAWLSRLGEKTEFIGIVSTVVLAGFCRGAVFAWLLESAGLAQEDEFWYRVAASILNGWTSTLITAAAVTAIIEHAKQVSELQAEQRRLTYLRDVLIPESLKAHRKLVDATKRNLNRIFQSLKGTEDERFLAIIRQTIDDVVRPVSYDLERNLPEPIESKALPIESRLDWAAVLRNSTRPGAIRPFEVSIFLALAVLPPASFKFGYFVALEIFIYLMTFGQLLLWVVSKLINPLLNQKSLWFRFATVMLSLSVVHLILVWASAGITRQTSDPNYFSNYSPLFFAISGFALAVGQSALEQSKLVRSNMRQVTRDLVWDTTRARELQRQRQRNLARELHGSIQAALASTFLKASEKAKQGKLTSAYKAKVANDLLDRLTQLDSSSPAPIALAAVLDKLNATWEGIATIHVETSPFIGDALAQDPICLTAVVDIIPELTFNAVKHGDAKHIFISVKQVSDREVELEVANDGKPEGLSGRPGLGTKMLADTALEWSRFSEGGLFTVRAVLPYLASSTKTAV